MSGLIHGRSATASLLASWLEGGGLSIGVEVVEGCLWMAFKENGLLLDAGLVNENTGSSGKSLLGRCSR